MKNKKNTWNFITIFQNLKLLRCLPIKDTHFLFVEINSTARNTEPPSALAIDNPCSSLMYNGRGSTQVYPHQFTDSNIVITSENQMNQIIPLVSFGGSHTDMRTAISQNHNGYLNYNYDPPPPYDWSGCRHPQTQYLNQTEDNLPVQYVTYQPEVKDDSCNSKGFGISCGVCCLAMCFIARIFI